MRLEQLIKSMELVACRQPAINMIVRSDVFRINAAPVLKYGVFAWTQGQHQGSVNGMQTYNFTLFYVDRLKEDLSNQIEIQSVGCEVLGNVLRTLVDDCDIEVGSYSLQPFNQRFTDECAGVFASVSMIVPSTYQCGEGYPDFNHDINDDFLII